MTHKHTHILTLCVFLLFQLVGIAGGLEKGFEALRLRDYYGAKKQFEKLRFKEPIGANYGLSKVHYERQNPFYDIGLSLRYCNRADSLYEFVLPREINRLEGMGIKRSNVLEFRNKVAERAFEDLRSEFTEEGLANYLDNYRFSKSYSKAVDMRDSIAFERAVSDGSYLAFRDFITEFPGAKQRVAADSLYALRFFEEKTTTGTLEDYKFFVKEFPANPYIGTAYDLIFEEVEDVGTLEAYEGYINEFPDNKNTDRAWRAINLIGLRDYQESTLKELIQNFPTNPYKDRLIEELEFIRNPYFVLNVGGGEQLIGLDGKALGPVLEKISKFYQGLAKVQDDELVGYIDKTGGMVIPVKYTDGFNFSDGLAVVESNGKFGAIDRFGEVAIPFEYEELGNMQEGMIAYERNGQSGFLDWNGIKVLETDFEYAADFVEQHAIVRADGMYGAIDKKGEFTVPCQFDWVEEIKNGLSRVRQGELFGLYKHGAGLVIPVEYESIGEDRDGLRSIAKDGLYGYVNNRGEIQIPLEFEFNKALINRIAFEGEYAVIVKNRKWGIIDRAANVVVKPIYDELVNTGYSIFPFRKNVKWGHVDNGGQQFSTLYDKTESFHQGLSKVRKANKEGYIDMNGKVVVPIEYDALDAIEDTEYVLFTSDSGVGLLTRTGERILEPIYDGIEAANIRYLKLRTGDKDELYDLSTLEVVWSAK